MSLFPRHDMSDMDSSSSSMNMVFTTTTTTPLYSPTWTPSSAGAYAGTCIFLVVLAVLGRLLLALKGVQEARWRDRDARRRYVSVAGKASLAERVASADDASSVMALSANGVEEKVVVVERKGPAARPWRFSVDPVRAVLDTVIVGIGYLLYVVTIPKHFV